MAEPSVLIIFSGVETAGENYNLVCHLLGIDQSQSMVSYQWTKSNSTSQTQVGTTNTLSFTPLKLSDAGQYICTVTVDNEMYGAIEYVSVDSKFKIVQLLFTMTDHKSLSHTVPAPLSVLVTSNKANPIRPIGSNVTLTCRVELSPAVDVPVTVNIQLTDPTGQSLAATTPSMDGSTYTSTSNISSFGRSKSGDYTCTSSVTSSLPYLINSGTKSATLKLTLGENTSLIATIMCITQFSI